MLSDHQIQQREADTADNIMHVLSTAVYTNIKFQLEPFQTHYGLLLGWVSHMLGIMA